MTDGGFPILDPDECGDARLVTLDSWQDHQARIPPPDSPAETNGHRDTAPQAATDEDVLGSWRPVTGQDLVAEGQQGEVRPILLARDDGSCAFYPAAVNALQGESESGKSWIAQKACAEAITAGQPALYVDFESTRAKVVERVAGLGAAKQAIADHFHYVGPVDPVNFTHSRYLAWLALLQEISPTIAVVDGVTDALTVHGLSLKDNEDWARFDRLLLRPMADVGAAALYLDHVTKSREGRGRYAIGAQHKLASVTGAAYIVDLIRPFVRGKEGACALTVAKDRPGHVREQCPDTERRKFGIATLTPDRYAPAAVTLTIAGPQRDSRWQPTDYMRKIVDYLSSCPDRTSSKSRIEADVPGKTDYIRRAVDELMDVGAVALDPQGAGRPTLVRLVRHWKPSLEPTRPNKVEDLALTEGRRSDKTLRDDDSPTLPEPGHNGLR